MTRNGNHKTTVSALMGTPVRDAQGALLGRVREFAVVPGRGFLAGPGISS